METNTINAETNTINAETPTITESGALFADPEQVEKLVLAEYEKAGFAKPDGDGGITIDDGAFKAKVFEIVTSKAVTDKSDKSQKSWTAGELYAKVFPGAPGTTPGTLGQLDMLETEVRAKLVRKVWTLTNPNRTGYVQKRLEEIGTTVLCRATVMRGLDEVNGVFITDNPELILSDSLAPRVEKLVKEANNLRQHATMITTRHPELENKVATAIGSGMKRTTAALPKPSSNGAGKKQDAGTESQEVSA